MRLIKRSVALIAILVCFNLLSYPDNDKTSGYQKPTGPTLKELAIERGIEIGGNFSALVKGTGTNNWESSQNINLEKAVAKDHCTIISAGWEMFPGNSWTGPGKYNFDGTDIFLEWAEENNLKVHAHGLGYVRYGTHPAPKWLVSQEITEENKPEFKSVYEHYLDTTLFHLKDRINIYDVCNESLRQGPYNPGGTPGYDTSKFLWKVFQEGSSVSTGFNYFDFTFRKARNLDSNAKLIYTDYKHEIICHKSDQMYKMMKRFFEDSIPIDGVGFQFHTTLNEKINNNPFDDVEYFESVRENFQRFNDLGLDIWVTEFECRVLDEGTAQLERQTKIYKESLKACLNFNQFKGFKMWALTDLAWNGVRANSPYMFDSNGKAKPAFYALQDVLQNYYPEILAESNLDTMEINEGTGWATDWKFIGSTAFSELEPGFTGVYSICLDNGDIAERSVRIKNINEAYLNFRWKYNGFVSGSPLTVNILNEEGTVVRTKEILKNPNIAGWQSCFVNLNEMPEDEELKFQIVLKNSETFSEVFIDDIKIIADKNGGLSTSSNISKNNKIKIYPNPSQNGYVTIEFPVEESKDVYYTIYNIQGRLVQNGRITKTKTLLSLKESKGINIINIKSRDLLYARELIIANY